jgi:fimbrial protein FimY
MHWDLRTHLLPPFFDRLEFLSQSINQPRKTDAPFIILVTEDNFLRSGFLNGQFPLSSCCDFTSLDDALGAQSQWPSARLVVDIESRSTGLIDQLDQLRSIACIPLPDAWLLIRADNYDARLFCKAAGPFHVLERQMNAAGLQHSLMEPRPFRAPIETGSRATNGPFCRSLPVARRYDRLPFCRIVPIAALSIASAAS